jgi:micrococcal nuclease
MPKKKAPKFNSKSTLVIVITLVIGFFGGTTYQSYQESQAEKLPSNPIVTRIIDGDNVELSTGESVRLYGVNCPEKKQPFSQEAIDLTTKLALNQEIRIDYQPNYKKDRWDRILGYVFIGDTHLNQELVKSGLCEVVIYEKRAKLIYQDELLQAQELAKQQKIGRWN